MVSSTLDLDLEWLIATLERLRAECAEDPGVRRAARRAA